MLAVGFTLHLRRGADPQLWRTARSTRSAPTAVYTPDGNDATPAAVAALPASRCPSGRAAFGVVAMERRAGAPAAPLHARRAADHARCRAHGRAGAAADLRIRGAQRAVDGRCHLSFRRRRHQRPAPAGARRRQSSILDGLWLFMQYTRLGVGDPRHLAGRRGGAVHGHSIRPHLFAGDGALGRPSRRRQASWSRRFRR